MVPALIAGVATREQASINLRWLTQQAGVAFIQATVRGIDPQGVLTTPRPSGPELRISKPESGRRYKAPRISKRNRHQTPRAGITCNQCSRCER